MVKKKKAFIISVVVFAVIVFTLNLNVFVMQEFIRTHAYTELEYRGYAAQDVSEIRIKHSYLNRILGYNEWIISVEFKKEPDILFQFTYQDDKMIFEGVSSGPMLDKDEILNYSERFKNGTLLYEFQNHLLDSATLLIEDEEADSKDIDLDSTQYGSFSSSAAKEICAFFKYKSPRHVGGLDRTLAVIFSADDLQVTASHEFTADHVQIRFLPSNEGTDYIFYLGTTIYQGVPAYDLQLFKISGLMWEPMPTDVPPLNDTGTYHLVDDSVLYYCEGGFYEAYVWNSEAGHFEYRPEF